MVNGITLTKDEKNNVYLCTINKFSEELQELLRARLVSICEGEYDSVRLGKFNTYASTLDEFLDRYNDKTENIKKGMIGELICHMLMVDCLDGFNCISPFFNMEERNIKKGHDLVYFREAENEVWAVEVKSGEQQAKPKTNTDLTLKLLEKADSGIGDKLGKIEKNIWKNALNGLHKVVEAGVTKDSIEEILGTYKERARKGVHAPSEYNVILASVLFNDVSSSIDISKIHEWKLESEIDAKYSSSLVFSFHKNTYQKIVDFLNEEYKEFSEETA